MRCFALLIAGLALLAGVAAAVSGGATQAKTRWVITDLGTLGRIGSEAVAMNERGQIVGAIYNGSGVYEPCTRIDNLCGYSNGLSDGTHAFLWQNGRMTDLGTLGGDKSYAYAINERGQVVGTSATRSGDEHAFLWESGRMRDLGTLGGPDSEAVALNERGQVVGQSTTGAKNEDGDPIWHAFLWEKGTMRDLGTLGGRQSAATDINDRGQIVGTSDAATDKYGYPITHAFLWQNGKMRDLGVGEVREPGRGVFINERGQVIGNVRRSAFLWQSKKTTVLRPLVTASAINQAAFIVGTGVTSSSSPAHPYSWERGRARNLGHLGRGDRGRALDLNNRRQIVGRAGIGSPGGKSRAFVWQNGRMIELGGIRKTDWSVAVAINDSGQIIGYSRPTRLDPSHAVLWTLKR